MTTHKKPRSDEAVKSVCLQRSQAITSYTAGKPGLSVDGSTYTWAQLGAMYQNCIGLRTELAAARVTVETALAARDAADALREKVDEDVLRWAAGTYGENSAEAKAFGYVKPSHTPLTAQEKADAVAKAKATKEARGEVGKKAKAAVPTAPAEPPPAPPGTGTPNKS
jgi:hypothetical protein